ncbi:MAG TPA: DUF86 domain-containing protein [Desulfotignum sp.]|nr:DUF86 domain-containing protein [Desulfotignum sp.]
MVDKDVLFAKISSMNKHLDRVKKKSSLPLDRFLTSPDTQDIVLFNLHLAIQSCIDMAAHIVSEQGMGVAGSTNELFYLLEEHDVIDAALCEKTTRAVGLRNLIVHEYGRLDMKQIHEACRHDIQDLSAFAAAVMTTFNL